MAECHQWVSNTKISILKKGWYSYVRVSLKQEQYHNYMAQALFKIPLNFRYGAWFKQQVPSHSGGNNRV